jgi:predicted RNase H-like HicB family nuclease
MKSLTVHVIFYSEEGHYVAHCLEFDLVAQGESIEDSYKNLLDAIELQAEYALETGNLENLIQPAPPEYWRMLVKAEYDAEMCAGMKLPEILSHIDCSVVRGEQRYG